ncbi:MAG: hypothetical protein PHO32_06130, partial [Candidatus Cloacimonetes bacterium]|nr:hypothetical protein [Candidatus Cloacimonadota bacterium]
MRQDAMPQNMHRYEDIVNCITELTQSSFGNLNISNELSNIALIKLLKVPLSADDIKSQVNALYPKVVEELFASYHNEAFHYSLNRTHNPELSNDIAQETIYRLLKSQNRINEINSWVKKVVHSLLCEHYRARKGEQLLYKSLCCESELMHHLLANSSKIGLATYLHVIPESILCSQNYKSYLQLKEYDTLKAYSEANNLSYEAVKSKSKKIIKNLKAEILLAMGWGASPDILDYNLYKAIQSFIRKLLSLSTAITKGTYEDISKLHPSLPQVLSGYTSIEDWGITMISARRFRLYLFHLSPEQGPLMTTIFI